MTTGLRIINDNNELLIDSELFNPTYVQKVELNATPVITEGGWTELHLGYVKYEFRSNAISNIGSYIVAWTIPDNGNIDVYYRFTTNYDTLNDYLSVQVWANSSGSTLNFTLPTAYLFLDDVSNSYPLPATTGPALRMYNSSGTKTFDSLLTQLVPYDISDSFYIPNANTTTVNNVVMSLPSTPAFLVPQMSAFQIIQVANQMSHKEKGWAAAYRRIGSTVYCRTAQDTYAFEDVAWQQFGFNVIYYNGNRYDLSVIATDATTYAAPNPPSVNGQNPTYTLSSSSSTVSEGSSVTITLTTTLINVGTVFPWTVTGISSADLSSGGLTGSFTIAANNTASTSFTIATDSVTETETLTLTLDGMGIGINVPINDTSPTESYSWGTVSNITEGNTTSMTFTGLNLPASRTATFSIVHITTGSTDITLNTTSYTFAGGTSESVTVSYSASTDSVVDPNETFKIRATVNGSTYDSGIITVTDVAPTYSLTAATSWDEQTSKTATFAATSASGVTVYFTTSNGIVVPTTSSLTISNNNFSTSIGYSVGDVSSNTSVTLYARDGSGNLLAQWSVTVIAQAAPLSVWLTNTFSSFTTVGQQQTFTVNSNQTTGLSVVASGTGSSYITLSTNYVTPGLGDPKNVTVTYNGPLDSTSRSVTITVYDQSFTFTLPYSNTPRVNYAAIQVADLSGNVVSDTTLGYNRKLKITGYTDVAASGPTQMRFEYQLFDIDNNNITTAILGTQYWDEVTMTTGNSYAIYFSLSNPINGNGWADYYGIDHVRFKVFCPTTPTYSYNTGYIYVTY